MDGGHVGLSGRSRGRVERRRGRDGKVDEGGAFGRARGDCCEEGEVEEASYGRGRGIVWGRLSPLVKQTAGERERAVSPLETSSPGWETAPQYTCRSRPLSGCACAPYGSRSSSRVAMLCDSSSARATETSAGLRTPRSGDVKPLVASRNQ